MVRRICIISLGVKGLIDATFLTPEIDTHELPRVSFWFSSRNFGKVAVIQKFQYFQNVRVLYGAAMLIISSKLYSGSQRFSSVGEEPRSAKREAVKREIEKR